MSVLSITPILIFGGGMIAVSTVIKTLEMSGKIELAKQVELIALLVGLGVIITSLGMLINQTKAVFGM